MAANVDPNKSTMASFSARIPSEEELPVVEVFKTSDGVVLKWGEGGAQQTTAGVDASYITDSFHAIDSNGDEPFRKTFGTLLHFHNGVLTIGETRYRIRVDTHPKQQPDAAAPAPGEVESTFFDTGLPAWKFSSSQIIKKQLDCSDLFAARTEEFALNHDENSVLSLEPLQELCEEGGIKFLPPKLFIRECMQDVFNEIVRRPLPTTHVLFGSPGVGKSVLGFLAALKSAIEGENPVLFIRKVGSMQSHPILVFVMRKTENDNEVEIEFHKRRDGTVNSIAANALGSPNNYQIFSDGPAHTAVDDSGGPGSVRITSAGHPTPKDDEESNLVLIPLSSWRLGELKKGLKAIFQISEENSEAIFDVVGGDIRKSSRVVNADGQLNQDRLEEEREKLKNIINNINKPDSLWDNILSTELRSSKDSIDRIRSMFVVPTSTNKNATMLLPKSNFVLSHLKSKVSLGKAIQGLQEAKNSGISPLYGWHFELYAHKVVQFFSAEIEKANLMTWGQLSLSYEEKERKKIAKNLKTCFGIIEGTDTGANSVGQLKGPLFYWMPSIFNFANIDAAIIVGDTLYCLQYTISTSHKFNHRTFDEKFFSNLPDTTRELISNISVIFIVPEGMGFTQVEIPASQSDIKTTLTCDITIHLINDEIVKYTAPRRTPAITFSSSTLKENVSAVSGPYPVFSFLSEELPKMKVSKEFSEGDFDGEVYFPSGSDTYHIVYSDFDAEDYNLTELYDGLRKFKKLRKKRPRSE